MLSQYPCLLCYNKLRLNGVDAHDFPRHLSPDRECPHSINEPINNLELVYLTLSLDDVVSNFLFRLPTEPEIKECIKLELTPLST